MSNLKDQISERIKRRDIMVESLIAKIEDSSFKGHEEKYLKKIKADMRILYKTNKELAFVNTS